MEPPFISHWRPPTLAHARKTARDLLTEQLTILDNQPKEVADNVARGDAEALLANGTFLEDKFRERDFLQPRSAETVSSGGA
jgi:hypothetical protein